MNMNMNKKTFTKTIAWTVTFALVLAIFPAMPGTVRAANLSWDSASQPVVADGDIITVQNGAAGTLNVPENATVTVEGSLSETTLGLTLDIASGAAVIWNADFICSSAAYLITVTGGGGRLTIYKELNNSGSGGALNITGTGTIVTVDYGGKVISEGTGYAVNIGVFGDTPVPNNSRLNVHGTVKAGTACAIRSTGIGSIVNIQSGTVSNSAGNNVNPAINMLSGYNGADATPPSYMNVMVQENGTVKSDSDNGYAIQTMGNVTIINGLVEAKNGRAINLVGMNGEAYISGGVVRTTGSGTAISTSTTKPETVANARIVVTGGHVEAAGTGTAIKITGANSTVSIFSVTSGGWVTAKSGLAIDASGVPETPVTITRGFVFAWGKGINNVVTVAKTSLSPSDYGIIAAWDTTTGTGISPYHEGDDATDLTLMTPSSNPQTVYWHHNTVTGENGLYYSNNARTLNTFPLDVEVYSDKYLLTIINGESDGETSLWVEEGETVNIVADAELYSVSIPERTGPPQFPPSSGNRFADWESDVSVTFDDSSSRSTSFTMPAENTTVTALFKPLYYFIVYNGEIAGGGLTSGYYAEGDRIGITANSSGPAGLFTTFGWDYGDTALLDSPTAQATEFTMPARVAYVGAAWSPNTGRPRWETKELKVINGTIVSTSVGEIINNSTESFYIGTTLNISADDPPSGFEFSHWDVTTSASLSWVTSNPNFDIDQYAPNTVVVLPDDDVRLTAVFVPIEYTLTVIDGVTENSIYKYVAGANVEVSNIVASGGRYFTGWTSNSGDVDFGADLHSSTASFTMPAHDVTVTALFDVTKYNLRVEYAIDSFIGVEPVYRYYERSFHMDETVSLIAESAPEGYIFSHWERTDNLTAVAAPAESESPATSVMLPGVDGLIFRAVYAELCEECGKYPCECPEPDDPNEPDDPDDPDPNVPNNPNDPNNTGNDGGSNRPINSGRRPTYTATTTTTTAYEKGDVNGDGKITARDALLILKHVSGKEIITGNALEAADVNGDGKVDANDALTILKFVTGMLDKI
ncbi:MAG: dockerin type I domain-containing protein [Oscillospiraceae bacterium]|nr:dockerin type I domain-containing protein [Oscillospiraceae bacterium]